MQPVSAQATTNCLCWRDATSSVIACGSCSSTCILALIACRSKSSTRLWNLTAGNLYCSTTITVCTRSMADAGAQLQPAAM
eukprot:3252401-Pyramimonas_sp.AAC.1